MDEDKIRSKFPGWNKGGAPLRSKPLMQSESYSDDEEEVYFNYGDIGGNIIVNPKSTIEDQIGDLLDEYYDISPMEFDPSKIEITTPDQVNQDEDFGDKDVPWESQTNEDDSELNIAKKKPTLDDVRMRHLAGIDDF